MPEISVLLTEFYNWEMIDWVIGSKNCDLPILQNIYFAAFQQ